MFGVIKQLEMKCCCRDITILGIHPVAAPCGVGARSLGA
jgi:hypothetical protein